MAMIKALPAIILLLFLISIFRIPKSSSKPAGFSLKLIRAYSPMSSLSYRNNTFHERYKSYVHASKARASYWTSFNKSTINKTTHPDVIRPPLTNEGESIVVVMRIGIPAQQVFLVFDTGAFHSWTQCAICTTCFPQSTAMYDPRLSHTYHEMPSDDRNCKPPVYIRNEQQCMYQSRYIAGQYSYGIVSYDTFADNNPFQPVGIHFGCSLVAAGFSWPPDTIISGVLGMSRTEESFPNQLSQYGEISRFSYCLVDINTAPSVVTRVTFGDDILIRPEETFAKVPFIEHHHTNSWAINLLDVSVGEERLNLPPGTFASNPVGGNGGLILDTGSPFSVITRVAFLGIKSKIQNHLSNSEDFTAISNQDDDFCYHYSRPNGQLPTDYLQTITFHFENDVDLVMPVTSVYLFNREDNTFCLGLWVGDNEWPNMLGSLQQQDTRFIYDYNENSLFFKPELCAENHA